MAEITERQLNAKPGDKDIWLNESAPKGHGRFIARITPGGDRLFYFRYTDSSGKRVRLPIGAYDRDGTTGLPLKVARQRARELADLYLSGISDLRSHLEAQQLAADAARDAEVARLAQEKAAAEAESARLAARRTVHDAFKYWHEHAISKRKDGGAYVRRMFERDVLPLIGDRYLADLKRGDILEVVDNITRRGSQEMARETFTCLRQFCRFAHAREWVEGDITAPLDRGAMFGKKREKERTLTENEIKELAEKIPGAALLQTTAAAIWIQLTTCCRIGELLAAEWKDVDLDAGEWRIPDTKNGKPHIVYLSPFALMHFQRLQTINGHSRWCYPNSKGTGPVSSKTITKQVTDRQLAEDRKPMSKRSPHVGALKLKGGKWTPHDLRRTGATLMTMLGVLPEVAERCLNHTEENRIKRIYQRYTYTKEMREAWQLLGERLELLNNSADNLTNFPRQRNISTSVEQL